MVRCRHTRARTRTSREGGHEGNGCLVAVLCSFVVSLLLLLLRRSRSVGWSRGLVFLDCLTNSRVLWRVSPLDRGVEISRFFPSRS